jgi:hypothetical protein
MASLTHWNFAAHFSGNDAAALILGIEPRESASDQSRIRVVLDRMELHYNHALKRHYHEAFQIVNENFQDMEANRPFELNSVQMNELRHQCDFYHDVTPFSDWLASDHQSQFVDQIFSRRVVADWLDATCLKSIYQFKLDQTSVGSEVTGHWPWGDHHTELLGHLEAAAVRYWVHYDPTDATSAPINKDVAEWLVNVRKVSKNMAESIASMLRVDGLPPGPRT